MIIDYAWGTPNYSALKPAGVTGVMRYISHDARKDLDAAELKALRAHGISVGMVFESSSGRALAGHAAGVADASYAKQRMSSLQLTGPVYFAVDFDATDAQKPAVADYLRGAASVLGHTRVGVYGGYWVIKYMAEHDACHWFWQTYAWSGGLVWLKKLLRGAHPSAHLYQYSNGHKLAGVSCDYNRSLQADWGQHPRPKPAPVPKPVPPKPKPPPAPKPKPPPKLGGHWQIVKTFYDGQTMTEKANNLRLWTLKQGDLKKKGVRHIEAHWVETG